LLRAWVRTATAAADFSEAASGLVSNNVLFGIRVQKVVLFVLVVVVLVLERALLTPTDSTNECVFTENESFDPSKMPGENTSNRGRERYSADPRFSFICKPDSNAVTKFPTPG